MQFAVLSALMQTDTGAQWEQGEGSLVVPGGGGPMHLYSEDAEKLGRMEGNHFLLWYHVSVRQLFLQW